MKTRDRWTKSDGCKSDHHHRSGSVKQVVRKGKGEGRCRRGGNPAAVQGAAPTTSPRPGQKRSGLEAVKLHLQATGGTGRTSRSATTVRRTSIRMTAIKEYPFDLSDLQKPAPTQGSNVTNTKPPPAPPVVMPPPEPVKKVSASDAADGKRKVSIMACEGSKDRENIPTERNGRVSGHADGPSRRKSNLHNAMAAADMDTSWDRPTHIEGRFKKHSTTSSIYSKKALSQQSEHVERSWWYACCKKCHQEESGIPSWEPPFWQKICPYPLCPSYRHFAQNLSVLIIGILVWITVWVILGDTAAPGGQLFTLTVLTIAAHFGGWFLVKITTLPALIGMLLTGIILKNAGCINFDEDYKSVCGYIRKAALTIILTRAGLDLDPEVMRKCFLTVLKLGLVPWGFECIMTAIMSKFLLGMPWVWAFLLGSVIAAVSPAVVVPCLFRLRKKGYGVSKGIPTLVLAVSGIDDAASVAIFGIISAVMFSSASMTMNIVKGPLSIIGGIAFGVICGYVVKFIPERNDAFLVPLRVLLLLAGGLLSVLGSEHIEWGGAGPLAVIAFAFVACKNWTEQGWDVEDNPVATAFEIFWMFFEPMLFGITGSQVVIAELEPHLVLIGTGILVACGILRILVTAACGIKSNLNLKEKFFVGFSWMAKATVQAALGPVALEHVHKMIDLSEEEKKNQLEYANIIVTLCILSIVITAPLGAIVITLTGPRMLTKTTQPPIMEGWRRSHRPSIRDISIIDEEDLAERDAEEATSPPSSPGPPSPPTANSTPAAAAPPAPITVQPNHRT